MLIYLELIKVMYNFAPSSREDTHKVSLG